MTIRARLTLWYAILLALALLVFSVSVSTVMSRALTGNLDAALLQRVNQLMPYVDVTNAGVRLRPPVEAPEPPPVMAALLTPSRSLVPGSSFGLPVALRVKLPVRSLSGIQALTSRGFRLMVAPVENNNRTVAYLMVWQSLAETNGALHTLTIVLLVAAPVVLILASMVGSLLAGHALAPVAQITRTAATISASDLSARVPVRRAHDELSELTSTFNAMIERLVAAVAREKRFTLDASHELRSPLAVIIAETSLGRETPLDRDEYDRILGAIQEQAASMRDLTEALLALARVEGTDDERELVPLEELTARAVRMCLPAARAKDAILAVDIPPSILVRVEPTLLTRAIRNVIDNAVKASPSRGIVSIEGVVVAGRVILTIRDQGPGVPRDLVDRVFEPFFQVMPARTPGETHGLGLAISQRVIESHGGDIRAAPGPGGTFRVTLPGAE